MAKLTTRQRSNLPASDFSGPDRSYPVNDMSHARNALARVSQFGTSELKAKVRAKVRKKFPQIAVDGAKPGHRADRPARK